MINDNLIRNQIALSTCDPYTFLSGERWRHALVKRPWLATHLEDVLITLRRGKRQQDPLNMRKYKYYWPCESLQPEFNHIVVVVLFAEESGEYGRATSNNYVVNVWAVYIYGEG